MLLAVAFFSVRRFVGGGWPIHHADPLLVVASALLFLAAYAFDRGDYLAAIDKAHAAAADLRAAVHDLEAAPVPAGRRRR